MTLCDGNTIQEPDLRLSAGNEPISGEFAQPDPADQNLDSALRPYGARRHSARAGTNPLQQNRRRQAAGAVLSAVTLSHQETGHRMRD